MNNLIIEHKKEKEESYNFKKRRFAEWNENYALYRDRVKTNRLTQRQAINIPIMRETIQSWISKIDDTPELLFKTKGKTYKHKNGEIALNELWKSYYDTLSLDILDGVDKKIVGLQGRSFKVIGISKGKIFIDLIDPYDIEISPKANFLDLNSAQYLIRTNIFKPVKELLANPSYSQEGKDFLKMYLATKDGIIKSKETYDAYIEKTNRLRDLGVQNDDLYNASETLVEINESYKMVWDIKDKKYKRHYIIIAADTVVLYNKPIENAIGIKKVPIVTWADDPDINDIWCDGKGDSVRTINKVVNMYISQDLENRTYRNFGMYFFDTKNGSYTPHAFEPKPFGMFGVPGNPREVLQQVEIPSLNDTTQQIQFLKDLIQSSVAQTAIERGEQTKSRTTLGEIQFSLENSGKRNSTSSKQYRRCWKQIGELFYELIANNTTGIITLEKKAPNGEIQTKNFLKNDLIFPEGYNCEVLIKSENDSRDQFLLQKTQFVLNAFADNLVAQKIAKRKQLELMNWTSEEISEVMSAYDVPQESAETNTDIPQTFNNQQIMQQMTA